MYGTFGRKLYTSFWETASPFLGQGLRVNCIHQVPNTVSKVDAIYGSVRKHHAKKYSTAAPHKTQQITRRFASGSFFVLGVSPSPSAVETGATCAINSERIFSHGKYPFDRRLLQNLSRNGQTRGLQVKRDDNSKSTGQSDSDERAGAKDTFNQFGDEKPEAQPKTTRGDKHEATPSKDRHLIHRLPQMPHLHRPTKEELLAAATGFWSRLKVRFKWFSIRSVRPFNLDEITALFSWIFLGHVVWVVLGTTTFFSLLIITINTVFAQGKSCVQESIICCPC